MRRRKNLKEKVKYIYLKILKGLELRRDWSFGKIEVSGIWFSIFSGVGGMEVYGGLSDVLMCEVRKIIVNFFLYVFIIYGLLIFLDLE